MIWEMRWYGLHIEDSYQVKKRDMEKILLNIQSKHSTNILFKYRDIKSLKREWIAHNRLYRFGIRRSHTKDVDFEYPSKYETIWKILGFTLSITHELKIRGFD